MKESALLLLSFFSVSVLATVVQTLDSAIHRINHYPADSLVGFPNTYPRDSDLSCGYRYPTFEQPGTGGHAIYRWNARLLEMENFTPDHMKGDVHTNVFLRTKFSRIHRCPNFLTHGAPLRTLQAREIAPLWFILWSIWNNSFLNCGCRWKWRMIIAVNFPI